jgi:hypothetical protein
MTYRITFPPPRPPGQVIPELAQLLGREYGITGMYRTWCAVVGLLSLPAGITVWLCDGRTLTWWHRQAFNTWSAHDTPGAAWRLAAQLAEAERS